MVSPSRSIKSSSIAIVEGRKCERIEGESMSMLRRSKKRDLSVVLTLRGRKGIGNLFF